MRTQLLGDITLDIALRRFVAQPASYRADNIHIEP